jgi:hypothetical protein
MAHIHFNHLNPTTFNNFIPSATKEANNDLFRKIIIISGVAIAIYMVVKIKKEMDRINNENK